MICPKCGFNQPEDVYCVLCGVNVGKFARRKRKKRLKTTLFALLLVVGAFVANMYYRDVFNLPSNQSTNSSRRSDEKVVAPINKAPSGKQKIGLQPVGSESEKTEDTALSTAEDDSNLKPNRKKQKNRKPGEAEPDGTLTAGEWFQKGIGLDDDSDGEIKCYQKAVEVDPTFAPAFFRLGAIYYRHARYEKADQAFSKFLMHATDEDKEIYDIYLYYSTASIERLLEGLKQEQAGPEEKKVSEEEKSEPQEPAGSEEAESEESSEKVMTIVHFSPTNGHITVPVVLNKALTVNMLVDTGAGITVLSKEVAEELDLEIENNRSITLKTMATDVQAQIAVLETIQVGSLQKNSFPVAVTGLPVGQAGQFNAILGMDFLHAYALHIDNVNHTFTLTAKTP